MKHYAYEKDVSSWSWDVLAQLERCLHPPRVVKAARARRIARPALTKPSRGRRRALVIKTGGVTIVFSGGSMAVRDG